MISQGYGKAGRRNRGIGIGLRAIFAPHTLLTGKTGKQKLGKKNRALLNVLAPHTLITQAFRKRKAKKALEQKQAVRLHRQQLAQERQDAASAAAFDRALAEEEAALELLMEEEAIEAEMEANGGVLPDGTQAPAIASATAVPPWLPWVIGGAVALFGIFMLRPKPQQSRRRL